MINQGSNETCHVCG